MIHVFSLHSTNLVRSSFCWVRQTMWQVMVTLMALLAPPMALLAQLMAPPIAQLIAQLMVPPMAPLMARLEVQLLVLPKDETAHMSGMFRMSMFIHFPKHANVYDRPCGSRTCYNQNNNVDSLVRAARPGWDAAVPIQPPCLSCVSSFFPVQPHTSSVSGQRYFLWFHVACKDIATQVHNTCNV